MAENSQFDELVKSWLPRMKGGLITFLNFYKSLADMAIDNLQKIEEQPQESKKPTNLREVKKDKEDK